MSYQSLNYFLQKNFADSSNINGYFDFSDFSKSGLEIISGNYFNKEDFLSLLVNNPTVSWVNSGQLTFDGNSYNKISGSISDSFFCAVAFNEIEKNKNNIIFSSHSDSGISGFKFGINSYGYPYIEYYDNSLGKTYFTHSEKINSNGLGAYYFGFNNINNFYIGTYSYEDNQILEESCDWIINYNKSEDCYIGGGPNNKTGDYLSGYLDEFLINENITFNGFDKNLIISGIVFDVIETVTNGIISGQTGILYGDVIVIKACNLFSSGITGLYLSTEYTGLDYYVPSYEEFIDFNNESFSEYLYSGVSGSAYKEVSNLSQVGNVICSNNYTGYNLFEYDSGYQIEYTIKTTSVVLKKPQYLYYIYDGIETSFNFQSGDIVSIFYQPANIILKEGTNYALTNYDFGLNAYYTNIANKISGLYYNGQYQRYSTGYKFFIKNGQNYYDPSEDFIPYNNVIYSKNNAYLPSEYINEILKFNLITDLWLDSGSAYILETGILSGQSILGANFENSMIFFNGQLLRSGTEYELPNKILLNIDSGSNVLLVNKLNVPVKSLQIDINSNNYGNKININDNFIENTSMVWLNGIRIFNSVDYREI